MRFFFEKERKIFDTDLSVHFL